nr:uncharacterized protein LOC106034625 [Anser cygnoides]
MPIQHQSTLCTGVRLCTHIHADVSAIPPYGNAHLCLSYLCKYTPTCVHKPTCHERVRVRRCVQPRIGVTGARTPTVLVAEPCRVAAEPGASPLGQTGCRRCPVPPGCVAARPGLMAGKESLLSALRGEVLRLREDGGPCMDTSPHLAAVCQLLESVLRKGLRQPVWGFRRRDYWHCLEQLPQGDSGRPNPLSLSIQRAATCSKALTAQGRGRCFLRSALQGKVLAAALRQLARSPRLLEFYDPASSVLGNEVLLEPFLSLVLVVTEMDFSLDLQNCSFLDESWLLPVCITYETVPCRVLGMVIRYVDGRVFVTEVLPESQAEVDEVVLAGDVLDEINGCSLRNASSGQVGGTGGWHVLPSASPARPPSAPLHPPLQAGAMVQKLKGQPLSFRVLRWRWHDGEVYEPLLPYLKVLKEKEPRFQLQRRPRRRVERETRKVQGGRLLYNLRYLGRSGVGTFGGKEVLEWAIPAVLEQHSAPREVLFDVKETEILVQEKASSKVLFRYLYPEVSCVGRRRESSHLFAFCVVSSPESPEGNTFDCLVFASGSEQECEEIIKRIGTKREEEKA